MKKSNTNPVPVVMLPINLAYDILMACNIANEHLKMMCKEILIDNPDEYCEDCKNYYKNNKKTISNLRKKVISMCSEISDSVKS